MGIQEDIFEEFFAKLKDDADFPDEVVEGLRKIWENNEMASQEKIIHLLKEKVGDAGKGKSD